MSRKARPDGTDPPTSPPRNRRVHRTSESVWRRGGTEVSLGEIPAVPDGQAAPESGVDTGMLPAIPAEESAATTASAGSAASSASLPEGPAASTGSRGSLAPTGYPQSPIVQPEAGAASGGTRAVVPGPETVGDPLAVQESDWMALARHQAQLVSQQDTVAAAWTPGGVEEDLEIDLTGSPSLVRPYARTGGRTRPVRDLDLEALVRTTLAGKEASTSPWLNPEHTSIIEMCSGTVSVAEIAARLAVPLGVARVIIADMMDLGLVDVMKTSAAEGDERDPDFLRRVLSGLQRL